jgi:monofunctional glycosyltransferase
MKTALRFIKPVFLFILIYVALSAFIVIFFRFVPPASTAFINEKSNPVWGMFSISDVNQKWMKVQNISKFAALAAIASEDQLFFDHYGFDFDQIEKAIKENEHRKRIRGASTISMQVAKNLFLSPGKNLIRKGFEAYFTVLLETFWGKERIIEVYLNIAEMGKEVYGIEAASELYYHKPSVKLNASEAACIIAILPNPTQRDPRNPSSYLLGRRDRILQQMSLIGGVDILKDYIDY